MNDGTEASQRAAEIGYHCRDAGMGAEELYGLGMRVQRLIEAVKRDIQKEKERFDRQVADYSMDDPKA